MNNNPNTDIAKPKENLKQRAYLNSVTSVIDYGARLLTSLIVTPFLVSGLGSTLFGVWKVLGQFTSYANMADIRITEVLKWSIAKNREAIPDEELRNYVTATFLILLIIVPLLLMAGSVIVYYSPYIAGIDDTKYITTIRIASSLLILSFIINKVFGVFESVLRGMNLGFKRMGLRALLFLFGGGLQIIAVLNGYGIITLALIQVIITICIGLTIFVIVKKNVPWFGWGKIDLKRSFSFLKISSWFMGSSLAKMILLNTDKVILGFIASPLIVTQYVITEYLVKSVSGVIKNIIHGVKPGIGKFLGLNEKNSLLKIRSFIHLISWTMFISFGCSILILNESFIEIWLGKNEFAGNLSNLMIVILTLQYLVIEIDGSFITLTLNLKRKVVIDFLSGIVSVVISFLLIEEYGIVGLCLGLISGRIIMSFYYPYLLSKLLNVSIENKIYKYVVCTVVLLFASYFVSSMINIKNLFAVMILFPLFSITVMMFIYATMYTDNHKIVIKSYIKSLDIINR